MTIHSIVIRKLLSTNAHLGRRVAAHHFKVYICGSRNGIAILDSDKTLICLRNACHFIGSPIRQKGRSFFVNTNSLFDEIIEQMATRIGCINDSQWRIGGFLTNCSSPKKIRSRNKKINFGSNQQPDCVVIIDADRKSSVILEADRLQIPIASLVDSNIPLGSYKRITYPIPANDPIQFVYLFRNSITKTVLLERGRIVAMKETAGEETTHRPELLQAPLDKGGLTNERKMELGRHQGRKPHFLATNPFRRPFIRGFRATTHSPMPIDELLEAAMQFFSESSTTNGVSGPAPEAPPRAPAPGPAPEAPPRAPAPGPAPEVPPLAPAPAEVPHAPHLNVDPNPPDPEIGGERLSQVYSRLIHTYRGTDTNFDALFKKALSIFEIKGKILQRMRVLDPGEDWLSGGAKFIKNPRGTEYASDTLHKILQDLEDRGPESTYFKSFFRQKRDWGDR